MDSMWSDYLELLALYSPIGLESIAAEWVSPTNIVHLKSPISEYNRFFTDFIGELDASLESEDVEVQDILSDFLDTEMSYIIRDWAGEKYKKFFIFPVDSVEDDSIDNARIEELIRTLMSYYENSMKDASSVYTPPVMSPPPLLWLCIPPPERLQLPVVEHVVEPVPEPVAEPLSVPEPVLEPVEEPVEEPVAEEQPEPEPEPEPVQPPKPVRLPTDTSSRAFLIRRETLRRKRSGHSRVKTRKSYPDL